MVKTFSCRKPTLGMKISLHQMAKENHLALSVLSSRSFELQGSSDNFDKLLKSRGWKQMASISDVRKGA